MVSAVSFLESFLRVLLSFLPSYYKIKLLFVWWLVLYGGADKLYRKSRNAALEARFEPGASAGDGIKIHLLVCMLFIFDFVLDFKTNSQGVF